MTQCASTCTKLTIYDGRCLTPGCIVKIGRFSSIRWIVQFGWFSFAGNRAICGWYLINADAPTDVRPLQQIDLDDIYFIER